MPDAAVALENLKNIEYEFIHNLKALGASRELSLAMTNFEQSILWIQKHLSTKEKNNVQE